MKSQILLAEPQTFESYSLVACEKEKSGEEQIDDDQENGLDHGPSVDQPISSAPAPVDNPSRHPTGVMVIPNITLFANPVVVSHKRRESIEVERADQSVVGRLRSERHKRTQISKAVEGVVSNL